MKRSNPNNTHPFRRMCLVIIGLVTMVYITIHIFKWTLVDIISVEPAMFIFINAILLISNVTLLVMSIDEIKEYINNK
jgi:hypothetical protein